MGRKLVTTTKEVVLDSKNNLFVELEVVQWSMVMFYEMTMADKVKLYVSMI